MQNERHGAPPRLAATGVRAAARASAQVEAGPQFPGPASWRGAAGIPLVVLAVLLLPAAAAADFCPGPQEENYDNTSGAAPSASARTAVRMVAEAVDFTEAPSDPGAAEARVPANASWKVKAHYVFENTAEREIRTTMIFPWAVPLRFGGFVEEPAEAEATDGEEEGVVCPLRRPTREAQRQARLEIQSFGFAVRVDGSAVPAELHMDVTCAGGLAYPFGHTFPLAFGPRATVNVDVEYALPAGPHPTEPGPREDCATYGVGFILRTGALWEGPIGEVVLRYRFAYPTRLLDLEGDVTLFHGPDSELIPYSSGPTTIAGAPFQLDLRCVDNESTLTLTGHDVEPKSDVLLDVHSRHQRSEILRWQGCPLDATTHRPARDCCAEVDGPPVSPPASELAADRGLAAKLWQCYRDTPFVAAPEADATAGTPAAADADGGGDRQVAEDARGDAAAGADAQDGTRPTTPPEAAPGPAGTTGRPTTEAGSSTSAPAPRGRKGCGCVVADPPGGRAAAVVLAVLVFLARRRGRPVPRRVRTARRADSSKTGITGTRRPCEGAPGNPPTPRHAPR
jgi:MYXO-CTERM domain-containing protein